LRLNVSEISQKARN